MSDMEGFHVVRGRKSRKTRGNVKMPVSCNKAVDENQTVDVDSFKMRLNNCILEVATSQFFKSSYENIIAALTLLNHEKAEIERSDPSDDGNIGNTSGIVDSTQLQQKNKDSPLLQQENSHKNFFILQQKNSHKDCPVPPHLNDHKDSPKDEVIPEDVDPSLISDLGSVSLSENVQQSIHLLSYGIGNFTSCLIARYQLGFLLALRNKLGSRCTECCVYDPVFSVQEKRLLESYGCQVIPENEEGKRECRAPTIAFLPHCGRALYNNLLWKNLTTAAGHGLSFLVLVGNSFSNILERTPERLLKNTGSYILKLSPYLSEVQLANTFTHKDVFNDMSIHYFLESPLRTALQRFGQDLQEPVYQGDDAEFIKR